MKKFILLLLICIFSSCGKSVYYAYRLNGQHSYYTLEVTKKKEIIYRAYSDKYYVYPKNTNLFVCIYSDKYAAKITKSYYGFGGTLSDLWTIKDEDNPRMQVGFLSFNNNIDSSVSYLIEEGNDTIVCTTDNFEYLKEGHGYKENGVLWFPKYMVKVDQIDYNKFPKSIRHLNLKNPRKTKI